MNPRLRYEESVIGDKGSGGVAGSVEVGGTGKGGVKSVGEGPVGGGVEGARAESKVGSGRERPLTPQFIQAFGDGIIEVRVPGLQLIDFYRTQMELAVEQEAREAKSDFHGKAGDVE